MQSAHDRDPPNDYGQRLKRMRYQRRMLPVELGRAVRRALDLLPDDEAAHDFVVHLEQAGHVRGTETYARQVGYAIRHTLGVSAQMLEDPPRLQSMVRSVLSPAASETHASVPAPTPPPRPKHQLVVTLTASEYERLRRAAGSHDARLFARELILEGLARRS